MIKANVGDKNLIGSLLEESFKDNLSVNFIVRQDEIRLKRIRVLMDYSFEVCFRFGEVWLSDDGKACALILYPHLKKTTFLSIWLDVMLIFKVISFRGIFKALRRETLIKKLQPKEKMAYLWFIGVNPLYQRLGIASKLLQEIIEDADKKNLPLYLETSTIRNLPWYERFGFQIYDQLDLGYTLYFLKRKFANP
jgi:ribosomal protein S18 acetylase RimI-like enzyme